MPGELSAKMITSLAQRCGSGRSKLVEVIDGGERVLAIQVSQTLAADLERAVSASRSYRDYGNRFTSTEDKNFIEQRSNAERALQGIEIRLECLKHSMKNMADGPTDAQTQNLNQILREKQKALRTLSLAEQNHNRFKEQMCQAERELTRSWEPVHSVLESIFANAMFTVGPGQQIVMGGDEQEMSDTSTPLALNLDSTHHTLRQSSKPARSEDQLSFPYPKAIDSVLFTKLVDRVLPEMALRAINTQVMRYHRDNYAGDYTNIRDFWFEKSMASVNRAFTSMHHDDLRRQFIANCQILGEGLESQVIGYERAERDALEMGFHGEILDILRSAVEDETHSSVSRINGVDAILSEYRLIREDLSWSQNGNPKRRLIKRHENTFPRDNSNGELAAPAENNQHTLTDAWVQNQGSIYSLEVPEIEHGAHINIDEGNPQKHESDTVYAEENTLSRADLEEKAPEDYCVQSKKRERDDIDDSNGPRRKKGRAELGESPSVRSPSAENISPNTRLTTAAAAAVDMMVISPNTSSSHPIRGHKAEAPKSTRGATPLRGASKSKTATAWGRSGKSLRLTRSGA
ncbi:hypothetical protein K458DRAFT_397584 [Lentithecium fluviatile CBS 122367]|uniref:Uncharacterized protein n=1 Tax=Lentithecium fluviatile CBS 122367 TaxID=1168545 RepID=A0A6G1ICX6_9PLEO|nr:hypothetical protein K458DRAFT_397584 [Lentithecium fluviatile CBS 122367]